MINGRHSHRLGQLILKLCLPTLVIADLDTVEKARHHKAALPERNKGLITTNYAISNWLLKEKDVDVLVDLPAKKKEIHFNSPYSCTIRIAYQTPITLNFQGAPHEVLARTFEDSLIFTNYDLFKNLQSDKLDGFVKDAHDIIVSATSIDELQQKIYDMIRDSSSECKAQFALDLIYDIDPSDIAEPGYIQEGLDWLYGIVSREEM